MIRGTDIAGRRYGDLTALHRTFQLKNGTWRWLCRCKCGVEENLIISVLNLGGKICCRACRNLITSAQRTTHGMTKSRTYITWKSMKTRCENPKAPDYPAYGGRGVTVCKRWQDSFEDFLADMGERPAGRTLDRRETNGNYEASNCRWATPKEQANNRRNNV